ncbi:hypothetical protein SteCoe_4923 [Stentor coeruleus]|uniref:Uncharacterized protein n=1 Tax=Stentor coeruleus TaxID=5963 RepID=A0A1R2CTT1_9CILI|nr:hypothetical protein SteCoe_4923 [Stentor coeruleus]
MDKKFVPSKVYVSGSKKDSGNGIKSKFSSTITSQFSNNSMSKVSKMIKLQENHLQNLSKASRSLRRSKLHHQELGSRIETLTKAYNDYNEESKQTELREEIMNKAAVKIQKVVKGYLLRKHIEEEWFNMKADRFIDLITDINSSHKKYLYLVGRLPVIAAITLQRAIRRHFFYLKIQRISKTYQVILFLKEQENYKKIRNLIPIFFAKDIIKGLKREKYVKKKLVAIRKKLCLITIKNYFAREKISWKIVRIRIRKYKRNMKMAPSKGIVKKNTIIKDGINNEGGGEQDNKKEKVRKEDKKDEKGNKGLKEDFKNEVSIENKDFSNERKDGKEEVKVKENIIIITDEKDNVICSSNSKNKIPSKNPSVKDIQKTSSQHNLAPKSSQSSSRSLNSNNISQVQITNTLSLPRNPSELNSCASQESIETTTTEREALLRQELLKRLEAERKIKVALGRISYGVKKLDEQRILPYLKTVSGIDPDSIPSQNFETVKMPPIKEKTQESKFSSKPPRIRKKYIPGSYMRDTMAFQIFKEREKYEEITIQPVPKIRAESTLMIPTQAFAQKVMGNPSARSKSTETKPVEKIDMPRRRFASISELVIPESMHQKKRVSIFFARPKKFVEKDEQTEEVSHDFRKVSLSFNDALPEYSAFLTQYTPQNKTKLEPIFGHHRLGKSMVNQGIIDL